MRLILVVGSEGRIGRGLVKAWTKNAETKVIGFDTSPSTICNVPNYVYIQGSVLNENDLCELRTQIETIQVELGIVGEMHGILNCFTAPDFDYSNMQPPKTLSAHDARIWAWKNYPSRDFLTQYETNVVGIHNLLTNLSDQYLNSKKLSIVNFSSMYALKSPNQDLFVNPNKFVFKAPAYSASKAAIKNYTEYLAKIYEGRGIRVNCIAPGSMEAGQSEEFKSRYGENTLTGRMMQLEDIVGAIEFLLSDDSRYMNGSCLTIDGGWSIR
jgi:NAD(P)-dependent dehydrogenase (short-subunit alcohol dehydrogenase family)